MPRVCNIVTAEKYFFGWSRSGLKRLICWLMSQDLELLPERRADERKQLPRGFAVHRRLDVQDVFQRYLSRGHVEIGAKVLAQPDVLGFGAEHELSDAHEAVLPVHMIEGAL